MVIKIAEEPENINTNSSFFPVPRIKNEGYRVYWNVNKGFEEEAQKVEDYFLECQSKSLSYYVDQNELLTKMVGYFQDNCYKSTLKMIVGACVHVFATLARFGVRPACTNEISQPSSIFMMADSGRGKTQVFEGAKKMIEAIRQQNGLNEDPVSERFRSDKDLVETIIDKLGYVSFFCDEAESIFHGKSSFKVDTRNEYLRASTSHIYTFPEKIKREMESSLRKDLSFANMNKFRVEELLNKYKMLKSNKQKKAKKDAEGDNDFGYDSEAVESIESYGKDRVKKAEEALANAERDIEMLEAKIDFIQMRPKASINFFFTSATEKVESSLMATQEHFGDGLFARFLFIVDNDEEQFSTDRKGRLGYPLGGLKSVAEMAKKKDVIDVSIDTDASEKLQEMQRFFNKMIKLKKPTKAIQTLKSIWERFISRVINVASYLGAPTGRIDMNTLNMAVKLCLDSIGDLNKFANAHLSTLAEKSGKQLTRTDEEQIVTYIRREKTSTQTEDVPLNVAMFANKPTSNKPTFQDEVKTVNESFLKIIPTLTEFNDSEKEEMKAWFLDDASFYAAINEILEVDKAINYKIILKKKRSVIGSLLMGKKAFLKVKDTIHATRTD